MVETNRGKGIIIVSYIALFLGIAGVGIGLIPYILPQTEPEQEKNVITGMWSSVGEEFFSVPQNSLTFIPNLLINFTIAEGDNAYFGFNGLVEVTTPSLIQFIFWISGSTYPQGYTNVNIPSIGGDNYTTQISFFYTLYEFTGGNHNATVSVYSSSVYTSLKFSRLLVQTFI